MKVIFFIILSIIMPAVSFAQTDTGMKQQVEAIKNDKTPAKKIAIIHAILGNTHEVAIHQQNGARDNNVYVHKDGHREMVVDKNGKPVKDGINDGSYNYYHPSKQPLMHYYGDISPWIMMGQSLKDPTTVTSRIYAYMGDLEGGIRRTHSQKNIPEVTLKNKMQKETIDTFLNAIEAGKADDLFELFDADAKLTDKKLIEVLIKLNKGFNEIYTKK